MKKSLIYAFWSLMFFAVVVISEFFVPPVQDIFMGGFIFLVPPIIFSLAGLLLFILALKSETTGRLRKFLLLTGASATGFFIGILLHNLLYALNIATSHIAVLKYLTEALHVLFFLAATIACPIGFLIGAVGSMALLIRNKDRS